MRRLILAACAASLACLLGSTNVVRAGSLEPLAPPAPTMKPLDVVEPRIPISSPDFIIDQPGAYYLTRDLNGFYGTLTVDVGFGAAVTIDLNGFTINGAGFGNGLFVGSDAVVTIRNGAITDVGIAVSADFATLILEDLRVERASSGIVANRAYVRRTEISRVGFASGLTVYGSAVIESSVFRSNLEGATLGPGSTVDNSSFIENGSGFVVAGGLVVGGGSTVRNSLFQGNNGFGIAIEDRVFVVGNNILQNVSDGILTLGAGESRIEGNNLVSNGGAGIRSSAGGMFIVKNSARANGSGNYIVSGPSNFFPTDPASPWANISY